MKECMKVFEEVVDEKCDVAISKGEDRVIIDVQLMFSNLTTVCLIPMLFILPTDIVFRT